MLKNDITWFDILALPDKLKEKLHLTDNEISFTNDDIYLINTSDYVNLQELKNMISYIGGFKNYEITEEIGISKAMYSMAFSDKSQNKRGLRMRTVIAILNAIRNRGIKEPFNKILVKGGIDL